MLCWDRPDPTSRASSSLRLASRLSGCAVANLTEIRADCNPAPATPALSCLSAESHSQKLGTCLTCHAWLIEDERVWELLCLAALKLARCEGVLGQACVVSAVRWDQHAVYANTKPVLAAVTGPLCMCKVSDCLLRLQRQHILGYPYRRMHGGSL